MALVPWSMGVNVSSDIVAARGTPIGPKTITAAAWQSGTNKTISGNGITRANPARVTTTAAHGLTTGDVVWISGIANASSSSGWTALNNRKYTITVTSQHDAVHAQRHQHRTPPASPAQRSTGGTVRKCLNANCEIVITSTGHGSAERLPGVLSPTSAA